MESTTQIFLRIQKTDDEKDTVKGEALVERYTDRIQIDSFSFDVSAIIPAPKNVEPSKAHILQFGQVSVSKFFDRSSTSLGQLLNPKGATEEGSSGKGPSALTKPLTEVRITIDQQLEETGGAAEAGKAKQQNAILVFHLVGDGFAAMLGFAGVVELAHPAVVQFGPAGAALLGPAQRQ